MSFLDGVLANPNLVSFLNGLHGKQVLVETKAGQKFVGVFGASSPELEIGLSYAWLKTPDNAKNILPRKDEIKEKMVFKFADIITVSAVWSEEKNIKGFATDREYHNLKTNGRTDEEELEVWECDNEDDIETEMPDQKQIYHKNGGWSVDEMFNANSRLHGVQSTFAEDMSQYTTVDFEATDEQKARAEQIAREIEQSSRSKFYSRLENDDDERDLDKTTNEDDAELGSKKRSNNNSFGSNPAGRNRTDRGAPPNRRAEGLRGDRKSSGQQPVQQQQQQQKFSQGPYNPRGAQYNISSAKRNSTGDDQFGGEWHNPPKDPQRPKDGGKIFENTNYKGRMERGVRGDKGRMDSLKQWGHEFSNTYKQSKQDDAKEQSEPLPRPVPETSSGNAWNNGPPVSLLNSQTVSSGIPTGEIQGPSEERRELSEEMDRLNLEDGKQNDEDQTEERERSETSDGSKKTFTFNPNAPAFTPRQQPTPTTPTQTGPMQQIPMGMVPGMPMQGTLAPGMVVPTGQPMIGPWHPGYVQMPTAPYQVYVPSQPMLGNMPIQGQRGTPVSQIGNYGNQQAPRRNGPGQQPVMVPGGQWTNQVVVQPMGYYPYQGGAGQQAQQFASNPQMVAQGQQGMPAQMYQQRYPTGYMVSQAGQQPRFPVSQQSSHPDGSGQYQSSAASTTGGSQPPTPGPQPPTVPSPAQHPHPSGRGSPAPPAAQQFAPQSTAHVIGPQSQPTYYPTQPNSMYMYNQQGGPVILTYAAGQMPMTPVQSEAQTHSHMDMQPHQQFMAHEQYGQFMSGPAYYQQQQPMSRQNSIPQNSYNGQPPAAPVPPASHPSSTTAPAQLPPPSTPSNPPQN